MPTDAELRALVNAMRSAARTPSAGPEALNNFAFVLESLLRPQEPEHAARERLGRWLTADLGKRTAHVDEPGPLLDRFHCQLFDGIGYRIESFEGDGATKDEAINAALDAAERGRT